MRLIVPAADLSLGSRVKLDKHRTHYLTNVLRRADGQDVYLCDGAGAEARCSLRRRGRDAELEVLAPSEFAATDARRSMHMGQGAAPRSRLDWAVEKMTEAGVASMTPLTDFGTSRTDKIEGSEERWRRIAISATAQCGRMRMPSIGSACGMAVWSESLPAGTVRLQLMPGAERTLSDCVRGANPTAPIAVLIGRTSGLSAEEESAASELGFAAAGLGERILRADTVGAVAAAVILSASGEY